MTALKIYKGENYLKLVYQRIAWIYLLKGNRTKYILNIEKTKSKDYSMHIKKHLIPFAFGKDIKTPVSHEMSSDV